MRWLVSNRLIALNDHLDYGCGKGYDAGELDCAKYDPYYFPTPVTDKFTTITCIYVLNVIREKRQRTKVIRDIKKLLKKGGVGYIVVRRGLKKEGTTSTGTFQCTVTLDLPIVTENSNFVIYMVVN